MKTIIKIIYNKVESPNSKKIFIFGIPVYSKKIRNFRVTCRVLFFKWSKFDILGYLQWNEESMKILKSDLDSIYQITSDANLSAKEAVWAHTFLSTTSQCKWLKNTAFSPGRWALGYPALYILFRVLNEAHPKSILELGLGQSTRMIGQYAGTYKDVEHIVIEHDINWIYFFKNDFTISDRSHILQCDCIMESYKGSEAVRMFDDLSEKLEGKRFDFIFIDAPIGSMKYSRIDTLKMLPDCLADSFVIIFDDTDRAGEVETLKEMWIKLEENGIPFLTGEYQGDKKASLICSPDKGFFASL